MNRVSCPELCPDCPLAPHIPEPRVLEQGGGFRALGTIVNTPTGSTASFDFENGRPVGPHLIEIGLLSEDSSYGRGYWVKDNVGLSGVTDAFEDCQGPETKRTGLLRLGKEAVCGAVL